MEKICRICGNLKSLEDFHLKKGTPDGHRNECKECVKDIQKKYKETPDFKEKQKEYDKKRYKELRDETIQKMREYRRENKEEVNVRTTFYVLFATHIVPGVILAAHRRDRHAVLRLTKKPNIIRLDCVFVVYPARQR